MNSTIDFVGYLAAELREAWWQLEALDLDSTGLLYSAAVGGAALVAAGYVLYKRCSQGPDTNNDLSRIHFYAGSAADSHTTNQCIELLKKNPHLVNTPLWKHCGISHGYTPFLRACWNNNFDLIRFMLQNGADIKLANSDRETALYLVAYRVSKSSAWDSRALKLLYEAGCSVDDVNVHNNTMLHLAAKAGNVTLTRWLLLHGADPDVCNACGFTPYTLALRKGSPAHLKVANLLRHPSDIGCARRQFDVEEDNLVMYRTSASCPVTGSP